MPPVIPCTRGGLRHPPGGAGPLPFQTSGFYHLCAVHDSLEDDVMLPAVAEIVLVTERLPLVP
jgi:hypothetical protein